MAGTLEGGRKAAETIKARYGKDHYNKIGEIGGKKSRNGGFASDKRDKNGLSGSERAKLAGSKGGKNRWKAKADLQQV